MNSEESSGGSSSNGQENGDGSERPLKKARFAWQVKGKYHLKRNENNDPDKISTTESIAPEIAVPSGGGSNSNNSYNISTEQDIATLDSYLLPKDLIKLDSVVDEPDKSVLKPGKRNRSTENNPVCNFISPRATIAEIFNSTRNITSHDNTESRLPSPIPKAHHPVTPQYLWPNNQHRDVYECVPMSMVETITEDDCIERWQTRQLARVPLDNTVNHVLDQIQHSSEEGDPMLESFDGMSFIPSLPVVNVVENEAILMAISAHGLQNTSNSSSSSTASSVRSPPLRIRFSPIPFYDQSNEQGQHEFEYALDNAHWSYSDELKNEEDETIPSPTFSDTSSGTSSLTFQNPYDNLHTADAASNDVAVENDDHVDFLDAAVLFAIQSRGLTTVGIDYG